MWTQRANGVWDYTIKPYTPAHQQAPPLLLQDISSERSLAPHLTQAPPSASGLPLPLPPQPPPRRLLQLLQLLTCVGVTSWAALLRIAEDDGQQVGRPRPYHCTPWPGPQPLTLSSYTLAWPSTPDPIIVHPGLALNP